MEGYTFKQYDSRWAKKIYDGDNMATGGCGPTSCASIIYAINKKIDPWTVAQWMKSKGYAVRHCGTAWAGIPAALKQFGMKDVKEAPSMTNVFSAMKKGHFAVFLFKGGTKGGVTWTLGGHYLAVTGYKEENGKHYFYMRDPGARNHDGWYCYETTMKGLIPAAWTCSKGEEQPVTKPVEQNTANLRHYGGSYPKAKVAQNTGTFLNIKYWQFFLNWWGGFNLTVDGSFGSKTLSATKKFQKAYGLKQDGIVGTNTLKKAKEIGSKEKH